MPSSEQQEVRDVIVAGGGAPPHVAGSTGMSSSRERAPIDLWEEPAAVSTYCTAHDSRHFRPEATRVIIRMHSKQH